ncbi:MAG TPA: carboxypeptidase-like regulatory domain-containing protein [Symbiobacteriaceae bacterium]|nr:carboxypeptidase-like regulatory domain-containing protein [Symbiobacteriaceae bacterium]
MRKAVLSAILVLALTGGAAAAPAPARSVVVNVVGAHGEPLAEAAVQVLTPGADQFRITQTNARGEASVPLPEGFSFWIRAWADGHAVAERPYVPSTDGPTLTITATPYETSLIGLVTDERGRPVEGARVSVWLTNLGLQASALTGPDGAYTIAGLQARDAYVVQVEARASQPFVQTDVSLAPGVLNQVDAEMTPSSSPVTGEVVNSRTGLPVNGIRVDLLLGDWGVVDRTVTDMFGYFHFAAPPWADSTYQVRLSGPGYETFASAAFAVNPGTWVNYSGDSRISLNPLYAELSGSVLSESGGGLSGTTVELQRSDLGTVENGKTDDNGYFLFSNLPAGTYRVRAVPTSGEEHAASTWITVAGGDRAAADVSANQTDTTSYGSSAIVGTVRDHLGDPVSGATVTASRGISSVQATTDAQGRYRLSVNANVEDAVDPETSSGYHVAVAKAGYIPTDLQETGDGTPPPALVDVRQKVTNRADFTLQPATAQVAGRALNDRGLPVSGVSISLVPEGAGTVLRTVTDSLGRYVFANLPVAKQTRYLPVVTDDRYFESSTAPGGTLLDPVALTPGGVLTHSLTLRPKVAVIQGEVKAGADLPAEGATVTLVSPADGKRWTAAVSGSGTYSLSVPAIPGRQYLIRAARADSTESTAPAVVDPGADFGAVVNLAVAPRAAIVGQVYLPDGKPTARAEVVLWQEGRHTAVAQAVTDELGYYRFADLAPGRRYTVAVWDGLFTFSTLAPGEAIITPLLSPGPGSTIRADLQAPAGRPGQ